MSAAQFDWPASDTLAAARQVRYLGWTCRTDHAVGGAEFDPLLTLQAVNLVHCQRLTGSRVGLGVVQDFCDPFIVWPQIRFQPFLHQSRQV
jgi:hypothetical protein